MELGDFIAEDFKAKNTDNEIDVFLGLKKALLIVDHEVAANSIKQVITWNLGRGLRNGDFISFEWNDPAAAAGTFDAPVISADGNSLTIGCHNGPGAKKGNHPYTIQVKLNGVVYSTETVHSVDTEQRDMTLKHPIIINK